MGEVGKLHSDEMTCTDPRCPTCPTGARFALAHHAREHNEQFQRERLSLVERAKAAEAEVARCKDSFLRADKKRREHEAEVARLTERIGWLVKRAQCDGFVTVSELCETLEKATPVTSSKEQTRTLRAAIAEAETWLTNAMNQRDKSVVMALEILQRALDAPGGQNVG